MTDAFAEFGFEKRPWLDPGEIRTRYHELAVPRHPDKCGGDPVPLSRLNEARGILTHHTQRLRHLLELTGPADDAGKTFQPDFNVFSRVGTLVAGATTISQKRNSPAGSLTAALSQSASESLRAEIEQAIREISERIARLEEKIRALDARWPDCGREELALVAGEFSFLRKWHESLREARTLLLGG